MAQMVERVLGKDEVTGSNPVSSSIKKERKIELAFFFYVLNLGLAKGNKEGSQK